MLFLASCGENPIEKQAGEMLEKAQTEFKGGDYAKAIATIDSLRKKFPKAIEARKQALKLYQEVELKRAEIQVQNADTVLQRVEREYQELKLSLIHISEPTRPY